MATNFPSSLDSFTNPTTSDTLASVPHASQHADVNDAVEAIETALLDGAPLFVDDANERVGIGTTIPAGKLHISDSNPIIWLTDTDTNADSYVSASSSVGSLILSADENNEVGSSQMSFKVDGAERITVLSSGNVGIGITTPSDTLDINGTLNVRDHIDFSDTTPDAANRVAIYPHGYEMYVDNAGAGTDNTRLWLNAPDEGEVVIGPRSGGSLLGNMRIRSNDISLEGNTYVTSGNVGIGDTSPSYKLDVNGDINTTGALRTDGKKTGLVLLTSGDVSSGGPITFTSLFSSEFDNYIVYLSELTCTGQNAIYYRTASSGSWNTSSVYSNQRIYGQTTAVGAQRFSSNYALIGYAGARESSYEVHFFSPYLSTQTSVMSRGAYSDNTNPGFIEIHHSYVDNTTSYDGFVFDEVSGGQSISCRYEVYGIPK